jgi:hypothetical protein
VSDWSKRRADFENSARSFLPLSVEEAFADGQLARRGTTFMATKVAHDEVPLEYFARLVRTSELNR